MLNILLRLFVNLILFYKNLRESQIFLWFFSPSHDIHQVKKVCFVALTPAWGLGDVVLKSSVITFCLKLCQELKASVYLLGGAEENVENEWIHKNVRAIHPTAHIYNLCGATLNQTINYINKADLFVGNDSGLMHISVAINTPSIAIFGSSHFSF